jgi:hypothetical protein
MRYVFPPPGSLRLATLLPQGKEGYIILKLIR